MGPTAVPVIFRELRRSHSLEHEKGTQGASVCWWKQCHYMQVLLYANKDILVIRININGYRVEVSEIETIINKPSEFPPRILPGNEDR